MYLYGSSDGHSCDNGRPVWISTNNEKMRYKKLNLIERILVKRKKERAEEGSRVGDYYRWDWTRGSKKEEK